MGPLHKLMVVMAAQTLLLAPRMAASSEGDAGVVGESRVAASGAVPTPPSGTNGLGMADRPEFPSCAKAPTEDDVSAAKKTYELANRYMGDAEYERASQYFRDAYRSDCTAHRLLNFIARAEELRGNRAGAIRALEAYLERAPKANDRVAVERRMANLRAQGATGPGAAASAMATLDGRGDESPVANERRLQAAASREEPKSSLGTWAPWVLSGVGAGLLVTGAVAYGVGSDGVSRAEGACDGRRCTNADDAKRGNEGRQWQSAGAVVGGVGSAMVLGGMAWWALDRLSGPAGREVSMRPRVAPQVAAHYAGVLVEGRF